MTLNLISEYKENHIDCIWCVKFHPFLKIFASCGSDEKISIWEYNDSKKTYVKSSSLEKTHNSIIRALDWDYSGKYLAAASFDKNISIWKLSNDSSPLKFICLNTIESSDSEIKSVSWSVSGNFVASCSRKGNIWIWEKDIDDFETEDFMCKSSFEGHKGDIKMVKFSPKEEVLFSCGFDETIKIWDLDLSKDDFILINTLKAHNGTVWYLEFNKEGNLFFTCSDDKSLILWAINYKEENPYKNITKLSIIGNLHKRPIYCCTLTSDEKNILTSSSDGNISIVRVIDNKLKLINKKYDAHEKYNINCISTNKNTNEIISCGDDCCIKLWKLMENY